MKIEQLLQKQFGYSQFRLGQKEIIQDILTGHNVLAVLPTGTGKSLCYQLPAYVLNRPVLIVSPLIRSSSTTKGKWRKESYCLK